MEKNLGGDRIGSGAKIKVDLHNWGRSSFNQSRIWRSTAGIGVGIPCFYEIGTNGTTFDIDINTLAHTIPTISPLFGSFKLQVDMFACPIRLYQGLLHNNAVNIGLKMAQVRLPSITLGLDEINEVITKSPTNPSSLLNYIGIKGYHQEKYQFNALPILAYYDIFKAYYSNKQETNAKVINNKLTDKENRPAIQIYTDNFSAVYKLMLEDTNLATEEHPNNYYYSMNENLTPWVPNNIIDEMDLVFKSLENIKSIKLNLSITEGQYNTSYMAEIDTTSKKGNITIPTNTPGIDFELDINLAEYEIEEKDGYTIIHIKPINFFEGFNTIEKITITSIVFNNYFSDIEILDFPLENIDEARRKILKKNNLLDRIILNNDMDFLPYSTNFEYFNENIDWKNKNMQGLWLKTYQSDIFNNWLNTDQIDLINEISSITVEHVSTDEGLKGQFTMDALIMANKVYRMLNRVAVSGGTYEDWQEVIYGENSIRRAESPIYIGGTSAMINFEEIVSTAGSDANGTEQVLGTLGGKGILTDRKGGSIIYKCEEPTIIMGIVSITPMVDYSQGNRWYVTDLDNMDNLHKPGLDGIGFQNLIANNVHWAESPDKALAKQPAWIHYQTAYNEDFGQFAYDPNEGEISLAQMVLNRNYEVDENGEIVDFTTYIDPSKYNYAFADPSITAQNFWIQLGFNVTSRRKMAAFEIPNL